MQFLNLCETFLTSILEKQSVQAKREPLGSSSNVRLRSPRVVPGCAGIGARRLRLWLRGLLVLGRLVHVSHLLLVLNDVRSFGIHRAAVTDFTVQQRNVLRSLVVGVRQVLVVVTGVG